MSRLLDKAVGSPGAGARAVFDTAIGGAAGGAAVGGAAGASNRAVTAFAAAVASLTAIETGGGGAHPTTSPAISAASLSSEALAISSAR